MAVRIWWRWWTLAGVTTAAIGGFAAYTVLQSPVKPAPVASNGSAARQPSREVSNIVTTSGTVRLRTGAVVRVGAQVSGIIQRLNVTVGSKVEKGAIIALVDPSAQLARLEQAKAQIEIDRVAQAKAIRDLDRVKQIAERGLIAVQQVDDLRWQVQASTARVAKSESDLRAAQVELSYTTIRAPISGTVASVSTQQGETVAASFAAPTFVTIVDERALELVAMVDETDIAGVEPSESIAFSVEAYPGREFKATVRSIDPTALIISGVVNYPVIAEIAAQTKDLKPDMTANIVITKASRTALTRPESGAYTLRQPAVASVTLGSKLFQAQVKPNNEESAGLAGKGSAGPGMKL
jgi:RND family efflux transporter MFP subunit